MVRIKEYQQTVNNERTPQSYIEAGNTNGAFGEQIARAYVNAGQSLQDAERAVLQYNDQISRTKALELKNSFYTEWEQPKLYSKEGYYNQLGANASGKSQLLIEDFDKFARQKAKEIGLTGPVANKYTEWIIADTKEKISRGVLAHDLKQTQEAEKAQIGLLMQNVIQQGVNDRNSAEDVDKCINNVVQASKMNAMSSNLDNAQAELLTRQNVSNAIGAIVQKGVSENNLFVGQYIEKYSKFLSPEQKQQLEDMFHKSKINVDSRNIANNLVSTCATREEAIRKAEQIQDLDLQDNVVQRINYSYNQTESFKKENERKSTEQFYQTVLDKQQRGLALSYEDIPSGVDAETTLGMMNYINKNGQIEANDEAIWDDLYDMQTNNAQAFAKLDLNKYRGYLTDGEYKQFLKAQETIKSGGYYSQIVDDNKMIDQALKDIGLKSDGKQKSAYSEIRALVREYEARKGRKINDDELMNITNSLGYEGEKGVKTYKLLEKGMKEKTGFIRDVMNDFNYYQKKHNGELPPDEEKYKIINRRINNFNQKNNNELSNSLVAPKIGDMWNGHRITSLYGHRTSPTTGASSNHKGVDLAYLNNEKFTAFASGIVVGKGYDKGLGNFVKVKSSDGTVHIYGHANNILVNMNDRITSGQVLGRAGSSGISTGPHLHYAKFKNGQYLNPLDNGGNVYVSNKTSGNRIAF